LVRGYAESESYFSCVVARAHWDGCWCEEVVVVDAEKISFYAIETRPLANATLTVSVADVMCTSHISETKNPLLGYHVLQLETIHRVYYMAFSTNEACNAMTANLQSTTMSATSMESRTEFMGSSLTPTGSDDILRATPLTVRTNFSGRWLPENRVVMNDRELLFPSGAYLGAQNVALTGSELCELSARVLRAAFGCCCKDQNDLNRYCAKVP
jgi:hypothetical protein